MACFLIGAGVVGADVAAESVDGAGGDVCYVGADGGAGSDVCDDGADGAVDGRGSWDAPREGGVGRWATRRYVVGEYVLVHVTPLNRLRPWYTGPFKVTRVSDDGNFVYGASFVDPMEVETGPYHVTRLRSIDMSRATVAEVAAHQLESGSAFVVAVRGHRVLADGMY